MSSRVIRTPYLAREASPSFGPDVEVLVGDELLGRVHQINCVMQPGREGDLLAPHPWHDRHRVGNGFRRGPCASSAQAGQKTRRRPRRVS